MTAEIRILPISVVALEMKHNVKAFDRFSNSNIM